MEKIIISLGILLLIIILRKITQYRQRVKYQKELQQFIRDRSDYYANERQKVMNHYKEKIISGQMDVYSALKDTAQLLAFNRGGEDGWKQEFAAFKKEMQQYL